MDTSISIFLSGSDKCDVEADLRYVSSNTLGRTYSAVVTIDNLKIYINRVEEARQIRDQFAQLITEWENETL